MGAAIYPNGVTGGGGGGGTIPSTAALLKGDGAGNAAATDLTGDVTTSGGQATSIANFVVTEAKLNLTDNTTADVSTSKHGLAPKLPNDSTKFLNGVGAYAVPPDTGAAVANPGAQLLGLTAINGVAATAMRSDGAPALSQAIAPTWTSQHTFAAGTITTSQPTNFTQTWNASGVTFSAIKLNVTNTASAAGSLLLDLGVGGSTLLGVTKDGRIFGAGGPNGGVLIGVSAANVVLPQGIEVVSSSLLTIESGNVIRASINRGAYGFQTSSAGQFWWSSASNNTNSPDTGFSRNAAGVVEVNNGTAGTYRDLKLSHVLAGGTAPTIAAGTGAGTSPTVSVISGSQDLAGQVSVTAGVTPATSSTVVTITLNRAFPTGCWVNLTPANSAAALLTGVTMVFCPAGSTTTWTIVSGTTALVATTVYLWNYTVLGY